MSRALLRMGSACALLLASCEAAPEADDTPGPAALACPAVEATQGEERKEAVHGFYPPTHSEAGKAIMPVTFVDGSSGEIVADADLGIEELPAQIYTAGGLGEIDRTLNFVHGKGSPLLHSGPLETYEGHNGCPVGVWEPAPRTYPCPNLVYRFGDWFVGVRTCQSDLSIAEKRDWAANLIGEQTDEGLLALSAEDPFELQRAGAHEGPQLILWRVKAKNDLGTSNGISFTPGLCDPDSPPDGDIRTMEDGTKVTFNQIQDGKSGIPDDWFVTWCEDGLVTIQVMNATQNFAEAAASGVRMRNVVLADAS